MGGYAFIPGDVVEKLPSMTAAAAKLCVALGRHMNGRGECWPSEERLAGESGMARRTVRRVRGELVDLGVLARNQRPRDAGGKFTIGVIKWAKIPANDAIKPQATTGPWSSEAKKPEATDGLEPQATSGLQKYPIREDTQQQDARTRARGIAADEGESEEGEERAEIIRRAIPTVADAAATRLARQYTVAELDRGCGRLKEEQARGKVMIAVAWLTSWLKEECGGNGKPKPVAVGEGGQNLWRL